MIEAVVRRIRAQLFRPIGWRGACIAIWVACTATATAGPPSAGRYSARLCVAVPSAEPACGPAEIEWRSGGRARVRISDVVYALRLRTSQVDVVHRHGAMQIDGFTAIYEWDGATLRFVDPDKNVRYEVRSVAQLKALPEGPAAAPPLARR